MTENLRRINFRVVLLLMTLEQVTVTASPYRKSTASPISLQRIGIAEIGKNPGETGISRK